MNSVGAWRGTQFGALPYESTFSVVLRFCWINRLSSAGLREVCLRKRNARKSPLWFAPWFDSDSFSTSTGIQVPSKDECTFYTRVPKALISERLRICPLCSEVGFHSFWFQLIALRTCPIHHCKLTDECQSCGVRLPSLWIRTSMAGHFLKCLTCGRYFAGARFDLASHFDLQVDQHKILTAFEAMRRWITVRTSGLYLFRKALLSRGQLKLDFNWWGESDSFTRSICLLSSSMPAGFSAEGCLPLTILTWRFPSKQAVISSRPDGWHQKRQDKLNGIYRATLRMLAHWAYGERAEPRCEAVNRLLTDGVVSLRHWDTKKLAFWLLRDFFEGSLAIERKEKISDARLRREVLLPELTHRDLIPRRSVKGVLLATYSVLFFRIEKLRASAIATDRDLRYFDLSVLAPLAGNRRNGVSTVGIVFPKVEGLPLSPFQKFSPAQHISRLRLAHPTFPRHKSDEKSSCN